MIKDLKMARFKVWLELITKQLTREFGYFCGIQYFGLISRIITDNVIPGSKNFYKSYIISRTHINNI